MTCFFTSPHALRLPTLTQAGKGSDRKTLRHHLTHPPSRGRRRRRGRLGFLRQRTAFLETTQTEIVGQSRGPTTYVKGNSANPDRGSAAFGQRDAAQSSQQTIKNGAYHDER